MRDYTVMRLVVYVFLLIMSVGLVMPLVAAAEGIPVESTVVAVTIPDDAVMDGELNGRLLFLLDRESPGDGQLYDRLGVRGVPVFGKTVFGVKPGDTILMTADDPDVYGYPIRLDEIPPGEYAAQVFFIRYTAFSRKGLPTIWAMADHGGGGSFSSNPGNLYSDVRSITIGEPTAFELTYEVARRVEYHDTDMVKYDSIRSEMLSDFWGADIYLGINVLLPADYDPSRLYPVLYLQGHHPGGTSPLGYDRTGGSSRDEFSDYWDDHAPDMIVVTIRDATPFYDTSYSVNSASMGPYGDAIVRDLIPYIEGKYGGIAASWARLLAGSSTGGWEALALQVFYPDIFGGVWAMCPDSVDFRAFQIVDLYNDSNAYTIGDGWITTERPAARDTSGNILWTIRQERYYERAIGGDTGTGLGQWAAWEAVYSPVREDGYPAHIWDHLSGEIDKEVAAYWSERYDLSRILRDNWSELGPKLAGKIHLRGGDMDNYYLNLSQYMLGDWLDGTADPHYGGYSVTAPRGGHSGGISDRELIEEMEVYLEGGGVTGRHIN